MRSTNDSTAKCDSEYRVELKYIARLAKVKGSMKVHKCIFPYLSGLQRY